MISERYLSEDDRVGIADLRAAGFAVRAVAAQLGRSPSTVSRELRRNRDPGSGQYRPFSAQRLAARRRARPGRGKLIRDQVLREFVAGRLEDLLPHGVRGRQLRVRTLFLGMMLCLADGRPGQLTRAHQALTTLPEADQTRLGVIAPWKTGPHQLTYRQTEHTHRMIARALAKDEPDSQATMSVPDVNMDTSEM